MNTNQFTITVQSFKNLIDSNEEIDIQQIAVLQAMINNLKAKQQKQAEDVLVKKEQAIVKKIISTEEKKQIISDFKADITGKYDIPFSKYECSFVLRNCRKVVKKQKPVKIVKEKVIKEKPTKIIKEKVIKEKVIKEKPVKIAKEKIVKEKAVKIAKEKIVKEKAVKIVKEKIVE